LEEVDTGLRLEDGIAYLTSDEVAAVDRAATEVFGISVPDLMGKAGLATATIARRMLGGREGRTVCLVGKGNNGGDGLVAARHLASWGTKVLVVLGASRAELRDVPAEQLRAVDQMGIEVSGPDSAIPSTDLIVDALLGYNSQGNPREPIATLIRRANESKIPVLAVDLPSGLDASSGEPGAPCIVANSTVTFGFPKSGFLNARAARFVGHLFLADISLPDLVYRRHGMDGRPFFKESVIEVTLPKPGSSLFKDDG
jgi:NAD(P)H-hydrate epimerase